MPDLKRGEAKFLLGCVASFTESFDREVADVLARELRGIVPEPVANVREQLQLLARQLESRQAAIRVHEAMTSLIKRVVLVERRRAAQAIELPLSKVVEPNVVGALNRELRRFDDLMSAPWFVEATTQRIPRLTDFLSIRFAADAAPDKPLLGPRLYDEKFHVLEAPALFLPDLAHYRWECSLRDAQIAVAFVDIDDFKAKNLALTETVVDLNILPPFMELIEAFVFARGHAYRFGGDEYVLVLPNVDAALAATMLGELGRRVAAATFRGTNERLSISQGVAVVEPDCPLTDREILARANDAKSVAKAKKKGSVFLSTAPEWSPTRVA